MSDPKEVSPTQSEPGWWVAYQAIKVRLRFTIALAILAAIALLWPWMTAIWERAASRLSSYVRPSTVSADSEYFCPMDPGVISVWPAICPICNMDLIPRKKGEAVLLPSGVVARMQISPYRLSLAGVRTVPIEQRVPSDGSESVLMVPMTSIVHRAEETLIYLERSPGMIEGVRVGLGRRVDDRVELTSGDVQESQRVVAMGTLLVDAESRLNPNLTTQYFGASDQMLANAPPPTSKRAAPRSPEDMQLSEAEQAIVDAQKWCPVTEEPLGSMGVPLFVSIGDRQIAICCEGCRGTLEKSPQKYIDWLEKKNASEEEPK